MSSRNFLLSAASFRASREAVRCLCSEERSAVVAEPGRARQPSKATAGAAARALEPGVAPAPESLSAAFVSGAGWTSGIQSSLPSPRASRLARACTAEREEEN